MDAVKGRIGIHGIAGWGCRRLLAFLGDWMTITHAGRAAAMLWLGALGIQAKNAPLIDLIQLSGPASFRFFPFLSVSGRRPTLT